MTVSTAEANRAAKEIFENYYVYCLACKVKVVFYELEKHKSSPEHLEKELALQEQDLKKDPMRWVKKYWPITGETTRWCPRCDRPIRNADWYAHLEGHNVKVQKPVF